jgi:hypothetical protein
MSRSALLRSRPSLARLIAAAATAVHGAPQTLLALALPALLAAWVAGAAIHRPLAARLDRALPAPGETLEALTDDPPAVFPSRQLAELVHGGTASQILDATAASALGSTLLAAGIALALLHGPLQCAALAVLRGRSRGERVTLLASAARLALPATALSALSAAGYAACLVAIDRLGILGRSLPEGVSGLLGSSAMRGLGDAARLALLLAGLFVVRSLLDLSRAALVERGGRSWLRPAAQALRCLPSLAGSLLPLYALYWLARLLAFALAWPLGAASGGSWAGLVAGFVAQQLLAGSLAGIRLLRLETVRRLLVAFEERNAAPVYKLEAPAVAAHS